MTKKVYIGMSADIIHPGHLNIIKEGTKLGKVTVGVLTDSAIASYKRLPYLDYEQRKLIVENIKGEMKLIFNQKLDMDLINNQKFIESFSDEKPEFILAGQPGWYLTEISASGNRHSISSTR